MEQPAEIKQREIPLHYDQMFPKRQGVNSERYAIISATATPGDSAPDSSRMENFHVARLSNVTYLSKDHTQVEIKGQNVRVWDNPMLVIGMKYKRSKIVGREEIQPSVLPSGTVVVGSSLDRGVQESELQGVDGSVREGTSNGYNGGGKQ